MAKNAITLERLVMNMKALKGEEPTGTDAEACAYLYTACLTQPIDSDWTQIYLYVAKRVYSRHRTKESGVQFPDDIQVRSLSDYHIAELRRLKQWIYETQTQAKQERERAERQKKREEEATKRFKEHRVTTVFGNVTVKRKLYQDGNGKYRFLLDEKTELVRGCHVRY